MRNSFKAFLKQFVTKNDWNFRHDTVVKTEPNWFHLAVVLLGKFHVAGVSNGGLSSFRAALDHTELFHSLLVLPGFPPNEEDFGALDRLAGVLPVTLYVGENDGDWREAAERADRELRELGGEISLTVSSGEGHSLQKLTNAE